MTLLETLVSSLLAISSISGSLALAIDARGSIDPTLKMRDLRNGFKEVTLDANAQWQFQPLPNGTWPYRTRRDGYGGDQE